MSDKISRLERRRLAALKSQEAYANDLMKDRDDERKRRNGRLIKLGAIAVQFMEAGDAALLSRFQDEVFRQFAKRAVDRRDFDIEEVGLDHENKPILSSGWFDEVREGLLTRNVTKAAPSKCAPTGSPRQSDEKVVGNAEQRVAAPAGPQSAPSQQATAPKVPQGAARPTSNGAGPGSTAPSTAASV